MRVSAVIQFQNITKRFPGVVALDQVSLDIEAGSLHAIVGENGAGKSTLMKCLSGVVSDYEGVLRIRDRRVRFRNTADAAQAGVAMIHQELVLVDDLSAAANIFLGREKMHALGLLDDRAMLRESRALLRQLECDISADRPVRELRVGDQQLVEIAKALSQQTDILVMDEPTSALTEVETERLFRVIAGLRERGTTILYISHKIDEVFRLADSITVMRDGKKIRTLATREANAREVTHLMVGREIEQVTPHARSLATEPLLEARNLSLAQPGHARKWRLKNINFTLRRGEILGIAGLMGAGRTELLETLFGCSSPPPTGEILLEGKPLRLSSPAQAKEAGLALVTEDRKRLGLFANMEVGPNITVCRLRELSRFGLLRSRTERKVAHAAAEQLAVKMPGLDAPITGLSGGNQQKAILARWLLTDPKVLLLDDPTRGIDVGGKAELYSLMDQLCRQGIGILVTSSELPELLTVCDRLLVLCEGHITGRLTRDEATEERIMELATQRPGTVV